MNYKQALSNRIKTPPVLLKITLISILFVFAINIELYSLKGFSIETVGDNQLSLMLFIMHIFSYFEIYAKYFVVGLILLIPDIISEPYLTHQHYLLNKDRKDLFKNTIVLMLIYIVAFVLWFIILTIILSLFRVKIFDFSWPKNLLNAMYSKLDFCSMALISIPKSAIKYPMPIVFILIMLRVIMGFFIIALSSFYITFKKNNVGYGIALAIFLYVISDLLFYSGNITWDLFNDPSTSFSLAPFAYQYTLCAFFTFENISVNFMYRTIHTYIFGAIIIAILLFLIKKEMKNKDLC